MTRRGARWKAVVGWTLGAIAIVAGGLFAWGVLVGGRILDVTREPAPIRRAAGGWEGQRLAALGDFQLGMWLDNEGVVAEAIREAVAARVAAVLLLGDFIYAQEGEPRAKIRRTKELLRPLRDAGIPTFAVLGNHDYGQDEPDEPPRPDRAALVREGLAEVGVRVLENEAAPLRRGGGSELWVVGIGPVWPGRSDPARALSQVPSGAPRVVIMHNPQSFGTIAAGAAPLAVAGHTHGGQIRVPWTEQWSWLTLVRGTEAVDGWIRADVGAPGNHLYVNRGIGFSTVPVRLNCRPELTIFTITPASDGAPR